jgi:hypothetical protein
MSIVELADGRIVLERLFGHFEFGIDYHLQEVKREKLMSSVRMLPDLFRPELHGNRRRVDTHTRGVCRCLINGPALNVETRNS